MVHSDDQVIIDQIVEHLTARGFDQLGYVGLGGKPWSDARRDLLMQRIAALDARCEVFEFKPRQGRYMAWPQQEQALAQWLADLPKPTAVVACYDVMGLRVLDSCREMRIAVPEEVAVISVDNDTLLCNLADPPMTSVAHDLQRIGYDAAALLDRLMSDKRHRKASVIQVPPTGVVERQSTDVLAIHDQRVAEAVRFIRQNACNGLLAENVATHVNLSRITLNRRFQNVFGRSVKQEIMRVQIGRCRQLLRETNYTLERIATLAGFQHPEYMSVAFKRETNQTPGQYRNQFRT